MKKRLVIIFMVALAFLLTCLVIAGGTFFDADARVDAADVEVDKPSPRHFFAPHEIVDEITTEENRQAAFEYALNRYTNLPVRTIDPAVWDAVERGLEALMTEIGEIRIAYAAEKEDIANRYLEWSLWYQEQTMASVTAQEAWDRMRDAHVAEGGEAADLPPRPPDFEPTAEELWTDPPIEALKRFDAITSVLFTEDQQLHLMYMPEDELIKLWEAIWTAAYDVQERGIRGDEGEMQIVWFNIGRNIDAILPTGITNNIAYTIVSRYVQPNHLIDEYQNERRRIDEEDDYERVVIQTNELIVAEGVIVTEAIYRILEDLGYVIGSGADWQDTLRNATLPLTGMFVLTAMLFFAAIMYLVFYRPAIASAQKEAGLLFILYVLVLALLWVLREQPYPFLPILVFPMLVSMLIDRRCAIVLSISVVTIGYFITDGSLPYLFFYSISSILICLLSRFTTQRSKIILVGFMVTAIHFALSLAIAFTLERNQVMNDWQGHIATASFTALNGLFTVIICVGSLPFWEALFGVVTPIKLLDLTNPTNLLLRRLTIEAPGTYHHSLMVANLAESAAYDIGANAHAARVGGYYHDVGKLKCPHFFAENINGENPHDHLEPINSAGLIISHISYGLTLAAQYRLPQFVRDIIREHHGTSLMQFFYVKAKEADPTVSEEDFRYPYTIPQSRESACVMLADTVEAAVRAMIVKVKSVEDIEKTIRDLIRHKLNDGQLADSELSIKDITTIEKSFIRVLKGTHHERIPYPKLDDESSGPRDSLVIRGLVRKD